MALDFGERQRQYDPQERNAAPGIFGGARAYRAQMGHAAGLKLSNNNDVVPLLFKILFPGWFAGFAFAAIAIGALVPAAIMSIGAANLFTRNFWKALSISASPRWARQESPK